MKKIIITLLLLLSASVPSLADNYFTMGVNDTLRINPNYQGHELKVPVRAHFDGRLDNWSVSIDGPGQDVFSVSQGYRGPGMSVPYIDSTGVSRVCEATLSISSQNNAAHSQSYSFIGVKGYWDSDGTGNYVPYGMVKWEAGDYPAMFYVFLKFNNPCPGGVITISGHLSSSNDARGGTIEPNDCTFQRTVYVYLGYNPGDIDGDEYFTISDITALISLVLSGEGDLLEGQELYAADVNGDGTVDITDVTLLIQKVLTGA